MITVTVTEVVTNAQGLHDALLAALPAVYTGLNVKPTEVKIFLTDAATGTDETTASDTVDTYLLSEPSVVDIVGDARAALLALDFDAVETSLNGAADLAALKVVLADTVLPVIYQLAAALGLSVDDPT